MPADEVKHIFYIVNYHFMKGYILKVYFIDSWNRTQNVFVTEKGTIQQLTFPFLASLKKCI